MNCSGAKGDPWLTNEQRSLLMAANPQPGRAIPSRLASNPTVAIDELHQESYCLLPHLYRTLQQMGGTASDMDRLKGIYRHTWARNQLMLQAIGPTIQALSRSDIDTVLLDDAALGLAYYRDTGRRPIYQVHVFVRDRFATEAAALMVRDGWTAGGASTIEQNERTLLTDYEHASGVRCTLSSHLPALSATPEVEEELWTRTMRVEEGHVQVRVLAPADQLVSICVAADVYPGQRRLLALSDALVILTSCADEVDWGHLVNLARTAKVMRPVERMLRYMRDALNAPVPSEVVQSVEESVSSQRFT